MQEPQGHREMQFLAPLICRQASTTHQILPPSQLEIGNRKFEINRYLQIQLEYMIFIFPAVPKTVQEKNTTKNL
jgi:hypothetical protein